MLPSSVETCMRSFTTKKTQHGFPVEPTNVEPNDSINEVVDANDKDELRSCQHFLMDADFDRTRHKVFNHAVQNLKGIVLNKKLEFFPTF